MNSLAHTIHNENHIIAKNIPQNNARNANFLALSEDLRARTISPELTAEST